MPTPSAGSLEETAGAFGESKGAMSGVGASRLGDMQLEGFGFQGLLEVDINAIMSSGDDLLSDF